MRAWLKDRELRRAPSNRTSRTHTDETSRPREKSFDREKWNALIKYDQDIAMLAAKLRPLGDKWVEELARAYLVLNDKQYLPGIVKKIIEDAKNENEQRQRLEEKSRAATRPWKEQQQDQATTATKEEQPPTAVTGRKGMWGRVIILICLVVGAVGVFVGKELLRTRQLHQMLLTAQSEVQKKLPMKVNDYMTLVGVNVGYTEWTYLYRVSLRQSDIKMPALEREVRKSVCVSNMKAMLKDGVSYGYEYRDTTGTLLGRLEITACP
jgi:hypothetical protein